jgi:transposase
LGLDVHAETITVAIAEPDGEVRSLGTIPNRAESIRKLIRKLGAEKLRVCYEAGPTGYVVYWQLAELGVQCEVVAPTLVPVKAGDRVKTDRRDAEKLARCYRSGDLTAVWVPDEGSEALRDLVRAREAAKQDQMRARHRLSKFLLRSGQRPPTGVRPWTRPYLIWVAQLRSTQIAQEATRQDYLHEVEHMRERVARLEQAITEAVKLASPALQQVINDLQALEPHSCECKVHAISHQNPSFLQDRVRLVEALESKWIEDCVDTGFLRGSDPVLIRIIERNSPKLTQFVVFGR